MRDRILSAFNKFGCTEKQIGDEIQRSTSNEQSNRPTLVSAAVLVPLIEHPMMISVLLTQRTETLPKHAGQIAFPGGRVEDTDHSLEDTALRETEEEIGIAPLDVAILGRLSQYETGTGYRVTPVVGLLQPPLEFKLEPSEVARIFEVPLDFVLDTSNHRIESHKGRPDSQKFRAMPYREHYIWGLTARILYELSNLLKRT